MQSAFDVAAGEGCSSAAGDEPVATTGFVGIATNQAALLKQLPRFCPTLPLRRRCVPPAAELLQSVDDG